MKILAYVYEGMTLLDMVGPIQAWSFMPGTEVQFVGKKIGPVKTDCGLTIMATHDLDTAWTDPDVLFVGGAGKPVLAVVGDEAVTAFLRDRGGRAKWVTSVCTGSLILGAAGLLQGYRAATYWSARDSLARFGAIRSDERVCIDRNRMTGGGITSGIDFGIAVAAHWAGEQTGRLIELMMEYAPQPPFGTGRPDLADAETLAIANQFLAAEFGEA
jgi:cyclohexyl-isocyanide hydratase